MERGIEERLLGLEKEDGRDLKDRVWKESKKLWRVGAPSILTRVSSFGILVVTQAFMGHIGEKELASYALVQTILIRFVNGILLGMSSALETLCGQAYGAGQYHMMGIYLQRSWIVLLGSSIFLIPLFVFTEPILRLLGESEELSRVGGKMGLWFLPILYYYLFSMTFQMYLQAQLKNMVMGWLSAISFVVHVILSWLMIDKLKWGVPGAMGAMIVSTWIMIIGEFIYVLGGWCPDTWKGFSKSAFFELWPVMKLSLSSGIMVCLELWYNAVLVLLAGYMKNATTAISAFSICLNITAWEFMISLGFLSAACVRVANELGRGDAKTAKFSIKVNLCISIVIGVVFWIIALAFGKYISYAFTSNIEVAKAVSSLSVLLAFSILLNSVQPVLTGVAIGAGWQDVVAYVNIICYYVMGIPLGVLLGYMSHLQVKGIWIGMICGVASQTLVLTYITWRTDWDAQVDRALARLNRWFLPPSEKLSQDNPSHASENS